MIKIGIIGATGMLGQPVAKEFIKSGFDVHLLVRDIKKARQTFGKDARLVKGDVQHTEILKQFLDGLDGVYLNLSVGQKSGVKDFQPEREGLDNILESAKNTTIKRIGYLSSLVHLYQAQNGFHWWAFDIKQKAVTKIKCSGFTYSIFYPSTFMESFGKGAYRQGNIIALAGTSNYKMFLISGNDYGKQVVKAFQLDNKNHNYIVQGQEGYTADQAAKLYVENYAEKKLRMMKTPIGLLKFLGKFINRFNYGVNILEALNNYPERFQAEKTWQDLGEPQTRFIDYIKNS